MTTAIRMLKDYAGIKAGTVLNHHEIVAERWIARGIAEKSNASGIDLKELAVPKVDDEAVKKAVGTVKDEALAQMKKMDADHKAEVAKLVAEAQEAFAMADKATAENVELKKQIEELKKTVKK